MCDIRETIRHYRDELNWESVQLRAEEWGAGNAVYLTLYFAKSLLRAKVPDALLDGLSPENCTESVAEAEELIFNDSYIDRRLSANPQSRKLFASKSAQETAALFLQRIFLPRATMAQLYDLPPDSPRIPLYYPVRLKDLLIRHSCTVWRIWRKDKIIARQFHQEERRFQLIDWLSH